MDKKSKVLFVCFILLILFSISFSFYKYIYLEDINFFTDPENIPGSFDPIKNIFTKI
ncbi:MAG: hypothetical protein WCW46_01095 [Candidatus Paceibacterota bacterium]|jgi:hypothetical protein